MWMLLGIVIQLCLNILSCLLRTLAVWYLAQSARNLAVAFTSVSYTCHVTRSTWPNSKRAITGNWTRETQDHPRSPLASWNKPNNWLEKGNFRMERTGETEKKPCDNLWRRWQGGIPQLNSESPRWKCYNLAGFQWRTKSVVRCLCFYS